MPKVIKIQNHLQYDSGNVQKCSFCEVERVCVSGIYGKNICHHCLQASSEVLDNQPAGSVSCLRCRQYLSFTLWYPGFIQVRYEAADLDRNYNTIYLPSIVRGGTECKWERGMRPTKAVCNDCNAIVPLDLFKRSSYIIL